VPYEEKKKGGAGEKPAHHLVLGVSILIGRPKNGGSPLWNLAATLGVNDDSSLAAA